MLSLHSGSWATYEVAPSNVPNCIYEFMRSKAVENRRQPHHPQKLQTERQKSAVLVQPAVVATTTAIRVAPYAVSSAQAIVPPSMQWVRGRNLDFCLLAFCSCVLAILCHQAVHLPSSQSASTSTLTTSSRVFPSQLDFLLKAGLFTSSQRSEGEEEVAE